MTSDRASRYNVNRNVLETNIVSNGILKISNGWNMHNANEYWQLYAKLHIVQIPTYFIHDTLQN